MTTPTTPFAKLLDELVKEYGASKGEFAAAANLTQTQLSRLLRPSSQHRAYAPDVRTCLRIAQITRCNGSKVLRAAGLSDIADLIEDLYGVAAQRRLNDDAVRVTPHERDHLSHWRQLPMRMRKAIDQLINSWLTCMAPRDQRATKESA